MPPKSPILGDLGGEDLSHDESRDLMTRLTGYLIHDRALISELADENRNDRALTSELGAWNSNDRALNSKSGLIWSLAFSLE
ncbi:hypothetical protein C7B65_00205 [Phormidesmis priestleyi ULC007]|uniref:Uncharacterized protein n=1 Tax=Phormidesmis priestleyi ULC007 TaxID=1920490 RepID=A0A2T1DN03_9CYAN|nr:hypothetical protein C7B65_00205 [Phormidesmis priestleyi ULC007]PZO50543.1 MAG: hypothetical protein DCF14_11495 [Phormidesmis priestleyi]